MDADIFAVYKRLAAKHSTEFQQITRTIIQPQNLEVGGKCTWYPPDLCTAEMTTFLKETN